ncbi:DUF499 domain-containing protein [Methylobacterium sp. E-016]|uniref:anti-phage-associated DUF499 domain-containing protein n=1 Tax=Methylobacterium sp. E-016 TaxID=2836556 RepID=UPI001FB9CF1C|nr:anti-phage-associated DUF499 domain-containing protein [Methylobacterium sp. E-016]MCJ2077672.1 DUF499 domain-containing protein [Methylobacterium sp. E-016]
MLQTVRDACAFDPKAIDYALSDQIEDLADLVGHTHGEAETFFDKTYVTGGMATLLRQGLQRLAGKSGQAVFELKQAMGGGKTHSMLALGYLAANPDVAKLVPSSVTEGFTPEMARVVAISGRSISREKHLWGDIAEQLGKPDGFLEFYKGVPRAPNEKDWIALIGSEPTLILLDELPPYFNNAVTQAVGGGTLADVTTYALSNLLSAALKKECPRLCVVISNLTGSYEGATKEITALVQRVTRDFQAEAGRQAKGITPVELGSDEIYNILRTRLLTKVPEPAIVDAVASAFSESISDAVKSKTVAKSATQIADEITASYPFHPSFKHILALFKDNERFRQTRGLMTLAAIMVRSVQARPLNDVYLVGCQHIDMAQTDIKDAITNIYDLSGAIAHDIAGSASERAHAQTIDDQTGNDAASQVARLVMMASLPEANGAVKGLAKPQIIENLVAPHRSAIQFDEAFEHLRTECWYLHRRENDAWVFAKNENLRKKIEKYAETAPQPKVDAEMQRRLMGVFEPRRRIAYAQVEALPKVEDIKPNGGRLLLVLSPDKRVPPEDAKRLFMAITQKNNFCVVTGDGSDMGKLEDKIRRIWAVAKVRDEDGGDRSPNVAELNEEAEQAEFDFNATLINLFNRVYYPARIPKEGDGLVHVALKLTSSKGKDGSSIDGETAVEEALASTGASKLQRAVDDTNVDSLRARAENELWVSADRRARWKDVEERAISNVRWPWLPIKGLEELKRRSVSTGDWRDNGDGYVEKGPFPAPRTAVKAATRQREDATGVATIEITPINAGPNARVHVGPDDKVSSSSPVLSDMIVERDDTVLWFLAVDPDGKHETGDPERWQNSLTITHDPREIMGKRTVALTVKPRGQIRWNLDGTNAREGKPYNKPIEVPGDGELTLYVYAEDAGVSTTKTFTIRPVTGGKAIIDPDKPASVRRKFKLATTEETFITLRAAKRTNTMFGNGVSVTAGKGDVSALTRFGPGANLTAQAIETFVAAARQALANETAEIEFGFGEMSFGSGRELTEFLEEVGAVVTVDPAEVVQ